MTRHCAHLQTVAALIACALSTSLAGEKRVAPAPESPSSFEKRANVAIVVGIDTYPQRSGLSRLKFAAKDATELARRLEAQHYMVTLLVNGDATGGGIISALQDAKKVLAESDGAILFFFSGHGYRETGENYLATYEATTGQLVTTGLSLSRVQAIMKDTGARRQVLLVDACRNDAMGKSVEKRSFGEFASAEGMRTLFSTRSGDVSYEDDGLQHGVFSHFLLRGLDGEATGADGLVTFDDLKSYVTRQVKAYGMSHPSVRVQVPFEAGESSGDFLIAVAPPAIAEENDAAPGKSSPGVARICVLDASRLAGSPSTETKEELDARTRGAVDLSAKQLGIDVVLPLKVTIYHASSLDATARIQAFLDGKAPFSDPISSVGSGSRVAVFDLQRVTEASVAGKGIAAQLRALRDRKVSATQMSAEVEAAQERWQQRVVNAVGKLAPQLGADLVLQTDAVMSFAPEIDITAQVTAAVDGEEWRKVTIPRATKIGILDPDRCTAGSAEGARIQARLNQEKQRWVSRLEALPQSERESAQKKATAELRASVEAAQNSWQERVLGVAEAVRLDQDLAFVVQTGVVLTFSRELDVTDAVIKSIDQGSR